MPLDAFLGAQLQALQASGLFRDPSEAGARAAVEASARAAGLAFLDASSNDYLGLARRPLSVSRETPHGEGAAASLHDEPGAREAARERTGEQPGPVELAGSDQGGGLDEDWPPGGDAPPPAGAGASRLVHGTHPEHLRLEAELARWVGLPAALLFTSGFAANLGTIAALAGKPVEIAGAGGVGGGEGAAIISDALNHASIIDGTRLARARVTVVPHRSVSAVEAALAGHRGALTRWVVTESYFSMDGDVANLAALRALCDRHRAFLVVDEAHALGVFGPRGAGLCAAAEIRPDVLIGAFGKAIGTQGAFVAGSEALRTFLWNRARSFVFSTALSPALARQTRQHLRDVQRADDRRENLRARSARLRELLADRGVAVMRDSTGPIVPVLAGSNARALAIAEALRKDGILAQPIRSPTVPAGFERIRITITGAHSDADITRLADSLGRAWQDTL